MARPGTTLSSLPISSLRAKLVGSLVLVLGVSTVASGLLATRHQAAQLGVASEQLSQALVQSNQELSASLTEAAGGVQGTVRELVRAQGEAIADLLALVAPAPLLSKDYLALNNFVRAVNQNATVALAVFLGADGKPLTRYVDSGKPALAGLATDSAGQKRSLADLIAEPEKDFSFALIPIPQH